MINECKIDLTVNDSGLFFYNITLIKYNKTNHYNNYIKSEEKFLSIPHKKIIFFLKEKTGLNQEKKIKILEKIWTLGKKEPFIKFNY